MGPGYASQNIMHKYSYFLTQIQKNMKDFSELKAKIEELAKKAPGFVDDILPHAVATVAANYFKENFQDESFEGEKWQEVNRRKDFYVRKKDGKSVKNYTKGAARIRPILTGETADLGKSLEADADKSVGGKAVVKTVHYGEYHNEGTENLPKRQFMGQTETLNEIISEELDKQFTKFFNA